MFPGDPRYMGTAALSDGDYIHAVMGSAGALQHFAVVSHCSVQRAEPTTKPARLRSLCSVATEDALTSMFCVLQISSLSSVRPFCRLVLCNACQLPCAQLDYVCIALCA